MVVKISFINFKGGVAKTITSTNFAATLADRDYKVLLVDLDPQSNASLWLLGERRFEVRLNEPKKTVYQLFLDMANTPQTHDFSFRDAVAKAVAKDYRQHVLTPNLDLLPNVYAAIDLEDKMRLYPGSMDILKQQLQDIQDNYDFIIFDCAPNLYLTTTNALVFSNYYIIPVFPDYFSRSGLTILTKQVKNIWVRYGRFSYDDLELMGVILTRIKTKATLDAGRWADLGRTLQDLKTQGFVTPNAIMFKPYFNDSVEIPRSIEAFIPTIYYKTSHPRVATYIQRMNEFTDEVLDNAAKRFPAIRR